MNIISPQQPLLSVTLVSEALQSARDALESTLALRRPDLLDPDTAKSAVQRVGQHGGTGEFLLATMRKLDAAQNQLLLEAGQPPQPVGFETVIRRWDVEDDSAEAVEHEPEYRVACRTAGGQVMVDIALADAGLAAIDGAPSLLLTVEINGGLPCVHVHGGAADAELASTLFADVGGMIVIRDGDSEGSWTHASDFTPKLERITSFVATASPVTRNGMPLEAPAEVLVPVPGSA